MEESATISLWKFEELLSKSQKYDTLIKKLIELSALSWSRDWLTFDSSEVSDLIRLIEPELYEDRLRRLISEDEKEK